MHVTPVRGAMQLQRKKGQGAPAGRVACGEGRWSWTLYLSSRPLTSQYQQYQRCLPPARPQDMSEADRQLLEGMVAEARKISNGGAWQRGGHIMCTGVCGKGCAAQRASCTATVQAPWRRGGELGARRVTGASLT